MRKMAIKTLQKQNIVLSIWWELGNRVCPQAMLRTLIHIELIQKTKENKSARTGVRFKCRQRTYYLEVHIAKCQREKTATTTASMEREPTHMWKNSRFWKYNLNLSAFNRYSDFASFFSFSFLFLHGPMIVIACASPNMLRQEKHILCRHFIQWDGVAATEHFRQILVQNSSE